MQIPKFNQTLQQLDNRSSLKRFKRSDDNLKLPENFEIGQAIGGGDCFFDSAAKGLVQIKTNEEFNVKLLRELCHKYALENEWVKTAVVSDARLKSHIPGTVKDNDIWNAYLLGIHYTVGDMGKMASSSEQINKDLYRTLISTDYGETLVAPIWGRSEIEGRIICEKYNVKLHVVEKHNVGGKGIWTDQIVDKLGSRSVSAEDIDYSENNVIHIINKGHLHFEPVLSTQETQRGKQGSSSDFSDYDDNQVNFDEELMRVVRNNDLQEEEKVEKIRGLLKDVANVNFKDANNENNTPLHIAVRKKELKVIELLVENKADINIKNDRGRSPLDIADRLNRQDIVQILKQPAQQKVSGTGEDKKSEIVISSSSRQHSAQVGRIDLKQQSADYNKVNNRLEEFINYFVKEFEAKLHAYNMILEGEVKKAGKFSDTFSGKVGQGVGGAAGGLVGFFLGSPVTGAKLGAAAGKTGGEKLGNKIGSKQHEKKVVNLLDLINLSQKDKANFRKVLVEAGFDVFQSLEMQFMRVTTSQGPKHAIHKLAKDATNRAINYMEEKDTSITEGVILGKSKREGVLSVNPGFEIKYEYQSNKREWNTANLYDKVGVLIIQKNKPSFYKKKGSTSDTGKYGYRRLFISESWDKLKEKYEHDNIVESKSVQFTDYNYILDQKDLEQKVESILGKINLDDKDLEEERIKKILEEVRDDIIEEVNALKRQSRGYVEDRKILVNIETNLKNLKINEYLKGFKQHFEEAKQERQKIAESIEEGREENREGFNQLSQKLDEIHSLVVTNQDGKQAKKSVWFDVRESVRSFTGREQQLNQIANNIQQGIVVVSGLGGVGKSELAIKYARSQYNQQDSVIWIDAKTRDTAKESFHRLSKDKLKIKIKDRDGEEKSIKSIVEDVYKYFAGKKSLFIFDNAEKYSMVEEFLPLGLPTDASKPYVLITSSNSLEWESMRVNIKVLPSLGDFIDTEAIEFVKKALEIKDDSQNKNIVELVKKLHNFPLVLQQVAVYIKNVNKEYQKRNSEFKISDYSKLLDFAPGTHKEIISKICEVTFNKIKKEEHGEKALHMLNIMAYLEPNHIPEKMFLSDLADSNQNNLIPITSLSEKYSIVRLDQGMLSIHGLVQEVIRLKGQQEEKGTLEKALKLLKEHMAASDGIKSYIPHIISVWKYAKEYDKLIESFIVNDDSKTTYFRLIAEGSSYEVVDAILKKIEKNYPGELSEVINAEGISKKVPLHYAIRGGNEQIMKLLINKGANVDAKDNSDHRPLHLAARDGYLEVVKALLDKSAKVDVETSDKYKFTPLHLAAQNGHTEIVRALLEKGANVNAKTGYKFTPLHLAAQSGHVKVANILLNQEGVEIEAKNGYQFTPLHLAAEKGNLGVVQVLISKGADVNALDRSDFTPLHLAAQKGHVEVVRELLKNNRIQVDVQTTKGNTPLHLAVENGHLESVQALIEKDADIVDVRNKDGKKALDLAIEKNHLVIQDYITQHSKNKEIPSKIQQNQHGTLDSTVKRDHSEVKEHSQSQKETFKKTKTSIDGQLYEIRLSTLLLLRGSEEKVDEFYLASNMEEAGKFDDIVFKYKYKGLEKSKVIFLQNKHREEGKEDTEKNRVTIDKLFSKSGSKDFSLEKYFNTFLDVRQKFSRGAGHPIFESEFKDLDCEFIIYTNAASAFNTNEGGVKKLQEGIEKVNVESDSILNFSEEKDHSYYKIDYKIALDISKGLNKKISVLKNVPNSNDDDIEKFLSSLKLFVGQPSQSKLGEIIKREIQRVYRVEEQDINSVFSEIESRVMTWWNKESYYLTKDNRFFKDALRISIQFDVKEQVALFTGREKELGELHSLLQGEGKVVISSSQKIASVVGLGGVGKTELTRKYISKHSENYDNNIMWINAENYQTIDESFRRLAQGKLKINTKDIDGKKERDIESIIPDVYKFFVERHRKSLFIFDNAGKHRTYGNEGIDKFLPSGSNAPHIVITSRDQDWGKDIKTLELDVFTEEEAIEFIRKALNIDIEDRSQEIKIKELAKTLQYLPLALTQAVAYIRTENEELKQLGKKVFTIENYLDHYKAKAEDLLKLKLGEEYGQYTETVFTTWTVTVEKIKQKNYGEEALEVLNISAYLDNHGVPIEELFLKLIRDEEIPRMSIRDFVKFIDSPEQTKLDRNQEVLHDAVKLLSQYSMINLESGVFSMHRLVQQVTRIKLHEESNEEKVVEKAFKLLKEGFPYYGDKLEDYAKKKQLLPHLEAFLSHMDDWVAKKPEDEQKVEKDYLEDLLALMGGDGYFDPGNPRRNKELLERALAIQEKHYGPDHFKVARTLIRLSNAYMGLGDPQKQKELLERALPILEKHYGHKHFEVAIILGNLGLTYGSLGDPQKEKELLEQALEITEKHYGPDHFEVARTLVNLGVAYGALGDPQKEKELLERALSIFEKHYGPDHFKVAGTLGNLGVAYGALGDPQKQKELLERALAIDERHYGPDHFEVAIILGNLGDAYGALGNSQKQKELLERALAIDERHYGPDHFQVVKLLANLGAAYVDLGDHHKAKELFERALPILEKHYGPDHFKVVKLLANLGAAYVALGDHHKAKELLERALAIDERHYGPDHFKVAGTLGNLGAAYVDLGDHHKAKELLERALPILEKHYGSEHFQVVKLLANLGAAYVALGDPQKAKELLERALAIDERHYGPDHFEVAIILGNLGAAYVYLGDPQKAKELLERALAIQEKHYGPDHFKVAGTLGNLGAAYVYLGDHHKAKELLKRALPILEKHYGSEHFQVVKLLANLGAAYVDLGDPQKAKELLERALAIDERHYGPDHFEVAIILGNLGAAYVYLGDPQKAKELLERALPIDEKHYGPDHFQVAGTLRSLGTAYGALGDSQKQKELLERALPILEKHYGHDHFEVAVILGNLGVAYGALGDPQKKKELLERALAIDEKHYGPDHFQVAITLVNLGNACVALGDPKKAKESLERALAIDEKHYGPDHFQVAGTLRSLGTAYGALGDPQKAKESLERALAIDEKHYGPDHFQVAGTLRSLGTAYGALGDPQKAKELLERALSIFEKHYGPDHFEVARALVNLGLAYGALGDPQKAKELLERALPIIERHNYHIAHQLRDKLKMLSILEVVKYPAEKVADLNVVDTDSRTPLHLAAENGELEVVKYPVEKVADLNVADKLFGRTPLHLAAENGELEVVKYLVEKGVDLNVVDKLFTSTPLHLAAEKEEWEVVKYLVEKGADLNVADKLFGRTPLHLAAEKEKWEVVKYLVEKGADLNVADKLFGRTPLYLAAEKEEWEVVKYLVEKGADLNVAGKDGLTPLYRAAQEEEWEVVKYLVEKGADLNSSDKDGKTPLHWAAEKGELDVVKLLIEKGADLNSPDKYVQTPLHWAAYSGRLDVVKYLVEKGADFTVPDKDGGTPLHFTAYNGHLDAVKYLVDEKGADFTVTTKNGRTPLHFAAYNGYLDTVKYLVDEKGADFTVATKDGRTPLHFAAYNGHLDTVKYLVDEKGADFKVADNYGWTLLHLVAKKGHLDMVQYLIDEKEADFNAKDKNGKTPLDIAKNNKEQRVVNFLKRKGAKKGKKCSIQAYEKQQKSFLHLGKYIDSNFPKVELKSVKQGVYLPSFESRNIEINGKCAAISRMFSQSLFLGGETLDRYRNSHKLLLNNLEISAELYERIAQGKQVSPREEREIFGLSKLLDGLEQQLDSPTSSLPSSLSHIKSYKTLESLSTYVAELSGDFALHLVTSNHVIAIYRTGNDYAYFDTNVAFISGIKNTQDLMKVVEKGVQFAGYELEPEGFLVEHFDVTKANSELTTKQKEILTKPIQTERHLLSLQDQRLGYIDLNGKKVSRVTLYDLGTKLHLEGSTPILINTDMNLSNENLLAYLNAGKISITAREYLENLRNRAIENTVEKTQELIQATKVIPFTGSRNEIKHAQQIQELLSSDVGNKLKSYELSKLLKSPVEESIKALPYYLNTANSKWPNRLTNAAGRIQLIRGVHGAAVSCDRERGNTKDCLLNTGEISLSLVSQLIEDKVIQNVPKLIKSLKTVKFGTHILRGGAAIISSPFDIYDVIDSAIDLHNCEKGSNECKDAIAAITFSSTSLASGVVLTAIGAPGVGTAVGLAIMVAQGAYSGGRAIEEFQPYRLTFDENFRLFWHVFALQPVPTDIEYIKARKDIISQIAKQVWEQLQNRSEHVVAHVTGLGDVTFKEELECKSVQKGLDRYQACTHRKVRVPILSPSNAVISMDKDNADTSKLARIIPDLPSSEAEMICLPKWSGIETYEYREVPTSERGCHSSSCLTKYKTVPYYNQSPTAIYSCDNAMVISHKQRMDQIQVPGNKKIVFDLNLVNQGMIVGSDKWNNDFIVSQGGAKVLGGENTKNIFVLTSNLFSGTIFGGKNSTNTLDASNLKNSHYLLHVDNLSTFDRIKYVQDYVINKKHVVEQVNIYGISNLIISANIEVVGNGDKYTFYVKPNAGHSRVNIPSGYLVFPDVALLLDCDSFTYSPESNVLSMKLSNFTLDIGNYFNKDQQTCNFELIDKHGSVIEPLVDSAQNNSQEVKLFNLRAETDLTYNNITGWYENIAKASGEYQVYGTVRVKYPIARERYGFYPHKIFGSEKSDVIPLTKETWSAEGRKGSDSYNVILGGSESSITTEINNYAEDKSLDLLYMPVNSIQAQRDENDLLLYAANSTYPVKVKDYFLGDNYQHLVVINDNKDTFIPLEGLSKDVSLVPFYHPTNNQHIFSLAAEKVASNSEVIVDAKLDDIRFYRDGNNLLLMDDKPLMVKLENFYDKHGNLTLNFWHNNHKDKLSSEQLFELAKLAINYQDEIKSTYYDNVKEYVVPASNTTIHHNQKFVNGSLTTVEPSTKRVGVLVLQDPSDIEVSVDNEDLVFFVAQNNATFTIKNWNDTDHRISALKFNQEIEVTGLDKFDLSQVSEIQPLINKAVLSSIAAQQLEKLDSNVVNGIKYLLAVRGIENGTNTYKCLGFDSAEEEQQFISAYHSSYSSEKLSQVLYHNQASKALVWLVVKGYTDLSLENQSIDRKNDLNKCFNAVTNKRIISRIVRKLEVENIEAVVPNVESFIRHHKEALEDRIVNSLRSNTTEIDTEEGTHRRKRRDVRVVKDYKDYVLFNAQNNANSSLKGQQVTSGGNKLSSWINTAFGFATKGISQLRNFFSSSKVSFPNINVEHPTLSSKQDSTRNNSTNLTPQIDVNGAILLLDVLIRKITGEKYISSVNQSVSLLEAQADALNITEEFGKILSITFNTSAEELIDLAEVQSNIFKAMMSGDGGRIPKILYSSVEEAKLEPEVTKKILGALEGFSLTNVSPSESQTKHLPSLPNTAYNKPQTCLSNIKVENSSVQLCRAV